MTAIPQAEVEAREHTVGELAELLVSTGDALCSAALYGSAKHVAMYEWMRKPQLGDLVLVTFAGWTTPAIQRVGYFVGSWTLIYPAEDGFEYESFRDHGREEVFMIELLNGEHLNWGNCQLMRLPRTNEEYRELVR